MVPASDALAAFGVRYEDVELWPLPASWHGDPHWRVEGKGRRWSLRLISEHRCRMGTGDVPLTDAMLAAQLAWADHVVAAGVPFMRRVATTWGAVLATVAAGSGADPSWRALLFDWLPGEHLITTTTAEAKAVGAFLRRLHDVGATFPATAALPVRDLVADRRPWLALLEDAVTLLPAPTRAHTALTSHIAAVRHHLAEAEGASGAAVDRVAVHGDVNVPNVLWDGAAICGLVDLDQVSAGTPIDELAWALKWWARADRRLARALVDGYGPLPDGPLASLTWLATCCHSYLVEGLVDDVAAGDHAGVVERVSFARRQGDELLETAAAALAT